MTTASTLIEGVSSGEFQQTPSGKVINFIAAAVGAGVGLLVGGGIEAGRQLITEGRISSWGSVGASAAGGAVSGGLAGLTMGGSLIVQAGVSGLTSAAGGATTRALTGQKQSLAASAQDFGVGVITFGLVKGGSTAVGAVKGAVTRQAEKTTIQETEKKVVQETEKKVVQQVEKKGVQEAEKKGVQESAAETIEKVAKSAELKPYGGPGGGHHVPAKSAFPGAEGYDLNKALAIPNEELARLNVRHGLISGAQQILYRAFGKTSKTLTWEVMEKIETQALVKGGMNFDTAQATVKQAINALREAGVAAPTKIPWGK